MAANSTKVTVTYTTVSKLEFSVSFYVAAGIVDPDNAGVQAIITAINALTRGKPIRITISAAEPHAVTATSGVDYVNEDKAEFVFQGEGGAAHTFKVPGLLASILNADKETIDATAGLAKDYCDAVAAGAQGSGGETLTQPTQGKRRTSRKSLKK